jgi:Trypsin-like serine proteases, typically periplasmic, contain C-terminal PDZ domain
MSENEKDNNSFDFIKEQVIEKKHKKIKKKLFPLVKTVGLAVLFGIAAAATFAIAEPKLYKTFHKEEDTKTPVSFPTQSPINSGASDGETKGNIPTGVNKPEVTKAPEPEPVIVKQTIDADIDDYLSMNDEIKKIAYDVNKSIVDIESIFSVKDVFGKTVQKTVDTTGVIIYNNSKDLLVLVSLDRVETAKSIKVAFSDEISVDAALQDYEKELNLAVVAVPLEDIPDIYLNNLNVASLGESYTLDVGDPIIALGSPNGHAASLMMGYVTSKGSYATITDNRLDLFNTSIADNKDSDGIIVNLKGEIIGIITRTLKKDLNVDLNTAICISKLKPLLTAMGNQEPRIYFGVETDDMTEPAKKEHDIINGVYVDDVLADSPAFEAGIQNGDIIMAVDDLAIVGSSDFYATISKYKPGDTITVQVKRASGSKEKEMNVQVTLAAKSK